MSKKHRTSKTYPVGASLLAARGALPPKIKKQRPPDVCAQKMGIEETAAAILGKVFRTALSLVGLFGYSILSAVCVHHRIVIRFGL
jgi:hypothetical protein